MYTTEEFAKLMGVDKTIAYGFLRFMVATGLATTTAKPREPGKKGKPTLIYGIGAAALENLQKRFNPETAVAQAV